MFPADWWKKAVIYELYVDKFAGNFNGLTEKLDYFTYLGVNVIWLLPHYPSPMIDGGYDISDYQSIKSDLGTMADFDKFIVSAHEKGLKVMLDMVLNHTSDEHPWFKESSSSKDNPKRNWYMWNDNQDRYPGAFVHFPETKSKNWIPNPATGDYYYATFYKEQPDLNWDNPEVYSAMEGVIDYWLIKGVDGLRLDAVSRLIKRDNTNCFALPETHAILKKLRAHIDLNFPGVILMAETGGWPNEAKNFFADGDECQLVLHFPLAVKILSSIGSHNLDKVSEIWNWTGAIPENCRWGVFLTNHDSVDLFFLGTDEEKRDLQNRTDPQRLFSWGENQSMGARLAEVCQGNMENIIWATKELLSQPGVPVLYYGNEIGMRNLPLPQKPMDLRDYVRGQFDWAEAERQQSDPNSILNQIRNLLIERSKNG